jgi:hypothetical protein
MYFCSAIAPYDRPRHAQKRRNAYAACYPDLFLCWRVAVRKTTIRTLYKRNVTLLEAPKCRRVVTQVLNYKPQFRSALGRRYRERMYLWLDLRARERYKGKLTSHA